jgi:hypothetical protein
MIFYYSIQSILFGESRRGKAHASKIIADNALKCVPQFNNGQEDYLEWEIAAQTLIDRQFYNNTATFQQLKKTLEGRPKKPIL